MKKLSNQEILQSITQEHNIVLAFLNEFKKMSVNINHEAMRESKHVLTKVITETLPHHFKFEEEHMFPRLREIKKTDRKALELVEQLEKDHAALMSAAGPLLVLLAHKNGNPEQLSDALLQFVFRLQRHAHLEDELFPSLAVAD